MIDALTEFSFMRAAKTARLLLRLGAGLCTLSLGACALAPPDTAQISSYALPKAEQGPLQRYGDRIESQLAASESAYWLLDRADLALSARLALIDQAQSTLDIQYFIWEPDPSGRILMRRLIYAADRGIRIRLLLDDLTLNRKDAEYVALDSHPGIEVRTFNPWKRRSQVGRVFEWVFRAGRLNHRMHIKTIVADNRFSIVGGRNIGDRYFGVYEEFVQNDLDIMAAGPIVSDVSDSFDAFWNSSQAYPVTTVSSGRETLQLDEFTRVIEATYSDQQDKFEAFPLQPAQWRDYFESLSVTYSPGVGVLEYDSPSIEDELPDQLYGPFRDFVSVAREELLIATAYFIPDQDFIDLLADLVDRGVRVVVLTNSLGTNNHAVAHSAYKRWRKRAVEVGVELYELRTDAQTTSYYTVPPTSTGRVGFHSKAVAVDGRWSFVGTPNLDPRSMLLNTEIGFFIDSEELTGRVKALLERDIAPQNAWRVTLDADGRLQWTGNPKTLKRQPARGFTQRMLEFFVNLLPLKKQA